mmetsp:Transcript_23275/g.30162  ORF Transcript_23275/g.30162 Transcript_23275/m.30162 type:complete len:96 (-) Transcript_23275:630-917(-)
MYSNYKLHGGSNYLVLPTSILLQRLARSKSSIFYGGIIRIESSASSFIRRVDPNELELEPKSIIIHRLQAVDYYLPRFFNGAKARVLGLPPKILK